MLLVQICKLFLSLAWDKSQQLWSYLDATRKPCSHVRTRAGLCKNIVPHIWTTKILNLQFYVSITWGRWHYWPHKIMHIRLLKINPQYGFHQPLLWQSATSVGCCLDETLGGRKTRGASNIVRIMQRTTSGGKCGVVKDLFVIIRASKIPRWVMSSPLCCPALSASSWQDPSS